MNFEKKWLALTLLQAWGMMEAACGTVLSTDCAAVGGVLQNGVCRLQPTYAGTALESFGTEWLFLDDDWTLDKGDALIGSGELPYSTFIFNVAEDAWMRKLINAGNGTLTLQGGSADYAWAIGHLASGMGSVGELRNDAGGAVVISGGSGANAEGMNALAVQGALGRINNASTGTITLQAGIGRASQAMNAFANGEGSRAEIVNVGRLVIVGSQQDASLTSNGVYGFAIHGGNVSVQNEALGHFAIEGGVAPGIYYVAEGLHGSDTVVFENAGQMTVTGGEAAGIYLVAHNKGEVTLTNRGSLIIEAGVASGIFVGTDDGGVFEGHNAANATVEVKTQTNSNGMEALALNAGKATLTNDGRLTLRGSQGCALGVLSDAGTVELTNGKTGVLNLMDHAIAQLGRNGGTVQVTNEGTVNLNRSGIGSFGTLSETSRLNFAAGSTLNTEAQALFDGTMGEATGSVTKVPITVLTSSSVSTVTTSHFVDASVVQSGTLTLKEDWRKNSHWSQGSKVVFSDIAEGTELAQSVKTQIHSAFGQGVNVVFTGTGSGSGSGASTFDMNVVTALISENKLAAGSVVTSEALTHEGKTFTLGNTGDMTQDTGFMGILGSSGITVKDGKTLTLMGSQASMAMAVGADTRDASYVITDSTLALTNGNLNLGHKAMSATEGTLADVTFDRMSTVNVENGIYTLASLNGEGSLNLSTGTRTDVTGELSATQVTNAGTLTVAGLTSLGAEAEAASTYAAPRSQIFVNENGATANLTGGLVVNDFATVKNKTGATINAGAVTVDTFGTINNYEGATLAYASVNADGIVRNLGTLNVTGTYAIGDEGETTFAGDTKVGTLSIGRTAKTMLMARDGQEAVLHNTGKTYADELDLVSGQVMVEKDSILAGKSLKNGAVGSDIIVSAGGTFGFSHDKSSLENALKNYTGSKADKAILALNTDLHFGQGGSLTVGSVDEAKGTVNLGSDALLLLGTTQLHGEALLNGESSQHLHVEDGAVIAMTDDLLWGNHYLMKGFDDASTAEILKVGILDKDGKALGTKKNDKGIFVTVGSDNILEKDKSYRMVNQMNWLLDGRQDLISEHGDVAFLTSALVDKHGASATNRMEALAMDAGVMAETQRMGAQVQTTMLDHASSARKGYGTFWVDGIYAKTDSGDFARSTGASAYEADTTGFAFGADLPLSDDSCRLGVAFSAQRGDLNGNDGLSSDIEGYGFSVYGGKTFESGLNVTGALTYMAASHEVSEYNLGRVKADIDADMWTLGARVSMPFVKNRLWMTPYLGADVMKVKQDAFTSSWSGMAAFQHGDVDATILRTPVGVKAGTFMPLELFGRSGTLNWDADLSFVPQFGDKDADYRVSGVTNGHTDGMTGDFVNDWLTTAKLGFGWQGAAGAFGIHYAVEKGDVRDWSSSVTAKASLFF